MAIGLTDQIDPMEEFIPREIHPKPFRPEEIDPAKVVISFDRPSDTLLIHLFGRGRASISVPVANYLYVMVDPDTETVIGFHIEGFLSQAVKDVPASIELLDYAEIRGITPAEVWALQREIAGPRHRRSERARTARTGSMPDLRQQAIAAFIDAERSRRDLAFVPALS